MGWKEQAKANVDRTEMIRQKEEELDRKARADALKNHAHAVELIKGNATAGRNEFIAEMADMKVKVSKRGNLVDPTGPWVGVEIGDLEGMIATINLNADVSAAGIDWRWAVQCGGRPSKPPKHDRVQSVAQGPSQPYVVQKFGEYFNFCHGLIYRRR